MQHLRYKSSLSVVGKKDKIMKDERQNHKFNDYIERFFNILSLVKEYEIINSTDNKCVLIVENNIFCSSTSSHRNPKKIGCLGWVWVFPPKPTPTPKTPNTQPNTQTQNTQYTQNPTQHPTQNTQKFWVSKIFFCVF